MKNLLSIGSIAVGSVALAVHLLQVQPAQAVSFIQNGDFTPTAGRTASAAFDGNSIVPNWTSAGYNFLVPGGTAFSTNMNAAPSPSNNIGIVKLYGATNQKVYAANGSAANPGWFIAADGAYNQGPISQTLTGLTIGKDYDVTFFQAAGQQDPYTGNTTDQWAVNLGGTFNSGTYGPNTNAFTGGTTKYSALMSALSAAPVSGWTPQKVTFKATAASEVLNFLAEGTPVGQPPFALLSGVSVTPAPVPEPLTIMGTLFGLGAGARLRSKLAKKK